MSRLHSQCPLVFILLFQNVCSQMQGGYPQPYPVPSDFLTLMKSYFDVFIKPWNTIDPSQTLPPNFNWFGQLYSNNLTEIANKCPPQGIFASFNPDHISAVTDLLALYNERFTDINSLLEFSQFLKTRPEIHRHVFYSAFLKAQFQSPELLKIPRPSAIELFPSEYFPDRVLQAALYQSQQQQLSFRTTRQIGQQQQCITVDETLGQDNGPNNALWYFREDIQLNSHHFIWHTIFPFSSTQFSSTSRRGELFYFFHHELLARYTTERLSNGFNVDPQTLFLDWNTVLVDGYNPHLTDAISSQVWTPRSPNTPLNGNTLQNDIGSRLQNLTIYHQRIVDLLTTGNINVNGRFVPLNNEDDINIIGDMFEASALSINPGYYGQPGLHNDEHWVIANVLSNSGGGSSIGVMSHSAVAVRDPIFYAVHKGIDTLFWGYKTAYLPPYAFSTGDHPLVFDGIRVNTIQVQSVVQGASPNNLGTFWNLRRFNLEGGLDFNPNNVNGAPTINVCAKHLDHEEFTYQIQVDNNRNSVVNGFVRIFMAPRFKSLTNQDRYTFEEQRVLFFSMDSFVQILQPGANVITRQSIDSTLTTPWPTSVQQARQDIQNGRTGQTNCQCGFPHHLLLPHGAEGSGMVFDLFVMITNADVDLVQGTSTTQSFGQCIPSHIHCGVLGQPYPDSKPLGYPFDRRPFTTPVQTQDANGNSFVVNRPPPNLEAFVGAVQNMGASQVIITHRNIQMGQ